MHTEQTVSSVLPKSATPAVIIILIYCYINNFSMPETKLNTEKTKKAKKQTLWLEQIQRRLVLQANNKTLESYT